MNRAQLRKAARQLPLMHWETKQLEQKWGSWVESQLDTKKGVEMGFPREHIMGNAWADEIADQARSRILDCK